MVHPPLTVIFDKNDLPSHNNLLHVWLILNTCIVYFNIFVNVWKLPCSNYTVWRMSYIAKQPIVAWFMVFNATFISISVISWLSCLLVEKTGVPGKSHRPVASHCQTISHNIVSSTPRHERGSNSQLLWW